jgi:hypothetical protein
MRRGAAHVVTALSDLHAATAEPPDELSRLGISRQLLLSRHRLVLRSPVSPT